MVQTYGVANEHGDSTHHAPGDEESSALLGGDSTVKRGKLEGHATIVSSVSNLANTIIGSGTRDSLLFNDCAHLET